MEILRIAAFSDHGRGGNPAGVVIGEGMPPASDMLRIAKEIGYSETAFLAPHSAAADGDWRVRYFAPQIEVPFCGHATIASGAALGERFGAGVYRLFLNDGEVQVRATPSVGGGFSASLRSTGTWSQPAPEGYVAEMLAAFQWSSADLDPRFPVRLAFAGARHLLLALHSRQTLAGMAYPFERVRDLMQQESLITISLLWAELPERFHARNPFAVGGVYEDPATGAAAAALGGYLRDIGWPGPERFEIVQGEDMGSPSRLWVSFTRQAGAPVEVSGETRHIREDGGH